MTFMAQAQQHASSCPLTHSLMLDYANTRVTTYMCSTTGTPEKHCDWLPLYY